MKSKEKFLNIEVGTFKQVKSSLTLKIDRSRFLIDKIEELKDLKKQELPFLELKKISEQGKNIIFQYEVPKEAENLKNIVKEPKAIRTAIALAILKQSVLTNSKYHVSLNPANIWYYPMKRVWYAYRANDLMPYDENKNFLKYKAVTLFCLTGVAYEKLVKNPTSAIENKEDELLKQIIATTSIFELIELLEDIYDFVSTCEWKSITQKDKKEKKKNKIICASIVLTSLFLLGSVHSLDNKKYNNLVKENEKQIREIKIENKIDNLLSTKEYKKADKVMKENDYSHEKRYKTFAKIKQYQLALNSKPNNLLKLIKQAYKDDPKVILDWKLPDNSSKKEKEILYFEKSIINYDQVKLENELAFVEDEDVLERLGTTFTNKGNFIYAEQVLTKLTDKNKGKAKHLEKLITYKKAQIELESAKKAKEEAEKIDSSKDKDKDGKVKEANSNLEMAQKSLQKAQKALNK